MSKAIIHKIEYRGKYMIFILLRNQIACQSTPTFVAKYVYFIL